MSRRLSDKIRLPGRLSSRRTDSPRTDFMGLKPSSRSCLPVTLDFEENVCREDVNFEIMSSRHNLSHKKRIRPPGGQILVSSGRTDFMGEPPEQPTKSLP